MSYQPRRTRDGYARGDAAEWTIGWITLAVAVLFMFGKDAALATLGAFWIADGLVGLHRWWPR